MTESTIAAVSPRLLTAKQVAEMLGCSWRTVLRLADAGRIPFGVKLGALRRWDSQELAAFLAGGCRPVRAGVR